MIPKSFILGAVKYDVEIVDSIDDTGLGRAVTCLAKIKLANKFYGIDIPYDSKRRTFYHELVHVICDEIGFKELSDNEKFVDAFSLLLNQFEQTKE